MGRGRGRGGKNRVFRRDFGKSHEHEDKKPRNEGPPGGWMDDVDYKNPDFEEYYKEQDIVPEGEWDAFMTTLKTPLPVTFRINGGGRFADHLRDKMQSDFFSHFSNGDVMVEDDSIQLPKALPWYPNNYAWHMAFTRQQLRKLPLLSEIHEFLKKANDHGSISRQEAVSMVPPLFLDVQPHHAVLDMCAAPGSKTQQLLEALHSGDSLPSGFVVANDADFQRCNLLTHQTKRVCSPCLLVTNHSAEQFPEVKKAGADGKEEPLRFDRILADVPCSGDGTMRKAPDIWRRWSVGGGNGLHLVQLRIALQGCKLLKVGGRMVYSTCTFNPIEDEAVVAELLELTRGSMELLDVSGEMPALRRMPGKTQWKVKDKFRWYNSWEEAKDVCVKLDPSMFPTPSKAALPLHRCMRFLPHHQDTGGFFVCVLKKVAELPEFDLPTAKDRQGVRPVQAAAEEAAEAAEAEEEAAAEEMEAGGDGEEEGVKEEEAEVKGEEVAEEVVGTEGAAKQEDVGAAGPGPGSAARPGGPAVEHVPPLEIAQQAAQQAIAAAERAISALEAKNLEEGGQAAIDANLAGARAGFALDVQNRAARTAAGRGSTGRGGSAAGRGRGKKRAEPDQQVLPSLAADAASSSPNPGPAAADSTPGPSGGDAAAAPEGDAAADGGPPRFKPSWVRGGGGRNREAGGRHSYIDPILPVEDPSLLQPLAEYYGLKPEFPLWKQLIARSAETARPKRLYFVCAVIQDIMVRDERELLKITATGLKVFERQDIKDSVDMCQYRLAQEGLPFILPYVTRQRVQLSKEDFLLLLRERALMLPEAQVLEPAANADARNAARPERSVITDPLLLAQVQAAKPGCVVAELRTADAEALGFACGPDAATSLTANAPLALSAWKGRASLAIMVDKNETTQMMDKIVAAMSKAS